MANHLEFTKEYRDGYWEAMGYHERGNAYLEERFKGTGGTHTGKNKESHRLSKLLPRKYDKSNKPLNDHQLHTLQININNPKYSKHKPHNTTSL